MTNRQQSAFFFAIFFLFVSGIGLVIYREYDQYYNQKTATELEAASSDEATVKNITYPSKPLPGKILKNNPN